MLLDTMLALATRTRHRHSPQLDDGHRIDSDGMLWRTARRQAKQALTRGRQRRRCTFRFTTHSSRSFGTFGHG
jgi:sugar lactone lactonase YvrE